MRFASALLLLLNANASATSPSMAPIMSPSPAPAELHVTHPDGSEVWNELPEDESRAKGAEHPDKAGIAFGVVAVVAVIGATAVVDKMRQDNVRRSKCSCAVLEDML